MADNWNVNLSPETHRSRIEYLLDDNNTSTTSTETGSSTSSTSSSSSSSESEEDDSRIVTIDVINNYDDAYKYAQMYWNKLQRDNGRELECQVWGSCFYKAGEWARVFLPSFDIDKYMYITRVSQSNDGGDWTATLTLVDYPPGWGKYEEPEKEDEDEEDGEDEEDEEEDT